MTFEVTCLRRVGVTLAVLFVLGACAAPPGPADTGAADAGTTAGPGGMRPASEKIPATDEAVEQARVDLARAQQAISNDWKTRSFEAFEAEVYREPDGGKYIVNGDTPIVDRKHLQEYFASMQNWRPHAGVGELIVHQVGGVDAVWSASDKRNLTYCVSTTFGARHGAVVAAMTAAAGAWEGAADVDFIHADMHDGNCTATNSQVVFDVRPVTGQSYLARAFFPNDARGHRNVLVNDSAFALDPAGTLTLTGILRHELGHTLGFRHEHTRPEAGTCFEDTNWRPLTGYDAFSTMHYPQCNGAGDWSLELTHADANGAACLYGPASGFTIDTAVCTPVVQPPPPTGCERTVTVSGQLARGQEAPYGPYAVLPGSRFTAKMTGSGDPDLYVRFRVRPTRDRYDCRPYLSGAMETCDLTVPTGATEAYIMVRGYAAGSYTLTITHMSGP